jgi:hypothetical protein
MYNNGINQARVKDAEKRETMDLHEVFLAYLSPEMVTENNRYHSRWFPVVTFDGKVTLPGGPIGPGETPEAALRRASAAQGWEIPSAARLTLHHTAVVDGRVVGWYQTSQPPVYLIEYAEKGRVRPEGWENLPLFLARAAAQGHECLGGLP